MLKLKNTLLAATLALATWLPLNAQETAPQTLTDLLIAKGVISQSEATQIGASGSASEEGLVALLVNKGLLTSAEANSLAQSQPAATAPTAKASDTSFTVKAKDKAVESLTISGRIQGQWDLLSTSYDNASDPDTENNFFMRRIYFGVQAKFADKLSGTVNANFANGADGTGEIEKAVIQYALSGNHTLTAGYMKTPMGYEETTSSSKIAAVERSIGTRYFTEQLDLGARHTGLFLSGEYESGVYFSVAATNPDQNSVASSSGTDKIAIWGQIGWSGDFAGGSLDTGFGAARIPESLNSGTTDMVWDWYANFKSGNFNILAEVLGGNIENEGLNGSDAKPIAFTILPSFKINKEFEVVARYSQFDADGGIGADISSVFRRAPESGSALYDDVQAYYIGGNWYIRGNTLKLSAGYEWARFDDNLTGEQGDADVDGFRTRLQLLF